MDKEVKYLGEKSLKSLIEKINSLFGNETPLMNNNADAGILKKVSRADHVHPRDDTKADKEYVDEYIYDNIEITDSEVKGIWDKAEYPYPHYGVRFTGSVSNGERLYDAVGLKANVGTDQETAENDFDEIMPWAGMKRCNTAIVNGERVPTFYEGEEGYSNTEVDVFVYVPLFYYHRSEDDKEHAVSMYPMKGYKAPSKFIRKDGTLRDYVFLPAYTAGIKDGVPVSRAGYFPHGASLTAWMDTIMKGQHMAGTLDGDIWIEGMKDDEIKCILLDIEFATRNHQTVMYGAANMRYASDVVTVGGVNQFTLESVDGNYVVGQVIAIGTTDKGGQNEANGTITGIDTATGVITFTPSSGGEVTVEAGNYISSRGWISGACDVVKASSGSLHDNTSGKYPCVYRGLENPWGNTYRWRWDYLKNDDQGYVLDDPENYAATIGEHHTPLSYKHPTTNGYATKMGFDGRFPYARVTEEIGGSSTTYFADYYYYAAGVRALRVGGDVSYARGAGARYCNVNGAPSSSGWYCCAALSPL